METNVGATDDTLHISLVDNKQDTYVLLTYSVLHIVCLDI